MIPVPVCKFFRRGRHHGFAEADWGYCSSKNWCFCGYKLGLRMTTAGIPDFFDPFPLGRSLLAVKELFA